MSYGGIVDSEYLQQQAVIALGEVGDPTLLTDEIKRTKDGALKDRLTTALCMASKGKSATPETLQLLKTSKEGVVRALAARALGQAQYKPAIPALTAALRDGYKRPVTGKAGDPGRYDVREDAATALRKLGFKVKRTDTAEGPTFEVQT
jgi:HEAT repeat protein